VASEWSLQCEQSQAFLAGKTRQSVI